MGNWSPDRYLEAWRFATRCHAGQTYGGPVQGEELAYLSHVGSVAMEVLWGLQSAPHLDGDLAVQCALLHDVLEDTPITYEGIVQRFGPAVAQGVRALTKDPSLPTKEARMADSLNRIRQQPVEIWMVKLADRVTNLDRPPYDWTEARMRSYWQEARQIHAALHAAHEGLAGRLLARIHAYPGFWGA